MSQAQEYQTEPSRQSAEDCVRQITTNYLRTVSLRRLERIAVGLKVMGLTNQYQRELFVLVEIELKRRGALR